MSAERVREYLLSHGIAYQTDEHPMAYTTQRVAEVEHISGKKMVKPVIVLVDGHFVMVVVPGHKRVDMEKVRAAVDSEDVRLATESEFAAVFDDCEAGAEPPIGGLYGMQTIVDERVRGDRVMFRGGSHTEVISMGVEDYLALAA
ncbi:MAG: deacylase, partial [Acidimicrobiia bacterium]|nr:deacylase [Acidimicrobiia bacterium]